MLQKHNLNADRISVRTKMTDDPKFIILSVILLHLLGLMVYLLDYYVFNIYINEYNNGLIPDQQMFVIRGTSVLSGNLPYENLQIYESLAPPLSMYVLSFPIILNWIIPIPLHLLYRIYFSSYNVMSTWLILKIGRIYFSEAKKNFPALFFGLNPFVISQGSISGSDECLGAFLMVLIVYFISKNNNVLTLLTIGVGTSIKYYPILLIPYYLATKPSIKSKVRYGFASTFSVVLFFVPFYFVNPSNFMAQFNNRIQKLPWDAEGNSGIVILIARMKIFDFAEYSDIYRICWILLIILCSSIQILYNKKEIEYVSVIPSLFFLVYAKFFFAYFMIILPLVILSLNSKKHGTILYILVNGGLIFGGMVNDRVFGYGSVFRQIPGQVPILMTIGILTFYVIWIIIFLSILLNWFTVVGDIPMRVVPSRTGS